MRTGSLVVFKKMDKGVEMIEMLSPAHVRRAVLASGGALRFEIEREHHITVLRMDPFGEFHFSWGERGYSTTYTSDGGCW